MPRPSESSAQVRRFSRGERWIHLSLATLMGLCILTAAFLYLDPLSALVGHRRFFATTHYLAGLLLPLPIVAGLILSRPFRADVRRLNRFHHYDWTWLKEVVRRRPEAPSGKFNAGQKLNSAFVFGAVLVLFATGLLLHFFELLSTDTRTGVTFTHDLFAAAVVVVAMGHVWMATIDDEARRGLRTGVVSSAWAAEEHALWEPDPSPDASNPGPSA